MHSIILLYIILAVSILTLYFTYKSTTPRSTPFIEKTVKKIEEIREQRATTKELNKARIISPTQRDHNELDTL